MGLSTSMDTWIITSTIARATTGPCQGAASDPRNTVQSFTVRQCMTLVATRHRAATDNVHLDHRAIFVMEVALTC